MEKAIFLYATLKGFNFTSTTSGIPIQKLIDLCKIDSCYNTAFNKTLIKILNISVKAMGLIYTSDYFGLSSDLLLALTNPVIEEKFLINARNEIMPLVIEKTTQTDNKNIETTSKIAPGLEFFTLPPINQRPLGYNTMNNPFNHSFCKSQVLGAVNSFHNDPFTFSKTETRVLDHRSQTPSNDPHSIHSNTTHIASTSAGSNTMKSGRILCSGPSCFPYHIPIKGDIKNPDYSFIP